MLSVRCPELYHSAMNDMHACACSIDVVRQEGSNLLGGCVSSSSTGNFKSVVLKSRRESAHARTFGGDFELKTLRMRGFSSRFWTMDLKFPVEKYVTAVQLL